MIQGRKRGRQRDEITGGNSKPRGIPPLSKLSPQITRINAGMAEPWFGARGTVPCRSGSSDATLQGSVPGMCPPRCPFPRGHRVAFLTPLPLPQSSKAQGAAFPWPSRASRCSLTSTLWLCGEHANPVAALEDSINTHKTDCRPPSHT